MIPKSYGPKMHFPPGARTFSGLILKSYGRPVRFSFFQPYWGTPPGSASLTTHLPVFLDPFHLPYGIASKKSSWLCLPTCTHFFVIAFPDPPNLQKVLRSDLCSQRVPMVWAGSVRGWFLACLCGTCYSVAQTIRGGLGKGRSPRAGACLGLWAHP